MKNPIRHWDASYQLAMYGIGLVVLGYLMTVGILLIF